MCESGCVCVGVRCVRVYDGEWITVIGMVLLGAVAKGFSESSSSFSDGIFRVS